LKAALEAVEVPAEVEEALAEGEHQPLPDFQIASSSIQSIVASLPSSKGGIDEYLEYAAASNPLRLARFLHRIQHELKEKVVLISNFTQTLDLFQHMCQDRG
jgi:SNF2 family DNA or RNA helicase